MHKKVKKSNQEVKLIVDERNIPDIEYDNDEMLINQSFFHQKFDLNTENLYINILSDYARKQNRSIYSRAIALAISIDKVINSISLLKFCNIINMDKEITDENFAEDFSLKILLIDKKEWNLEHEWRNAEIFVKRDEE